MCTVTLVPEADGFRLMCNRDEQRVRATAFAPTRHACPTGIAVYPVDPVGGGTWVGVNDARIAAALLNRTMKGGCASLGSGPVVSRGLIVPAILRCRSLQDAMDVAASLDVAAFNPFRLLVAQPMAAAVFSSDGVSLTVQAIDPSRACMLTSSSLGDRRVAKPRADLFERLVVRHEGGLLDGQARFHSHRWQARGAISVTMERSDARTVSRTTISVTSRGIELRYDPMDASPPYVVQAS